MQLADRRQADEVMAKVSAYARQREHGNAALALKAVEAGYKKLAGFDADTLNSRPSWNAPTAHS
ncbi:MAG: hypothetical protein MO853_01615 [Candidatus Protistobacter heckmanni]|nr:hypothetical protein [Candidatus Protistobacter heckmanni]